MLSICCNNQVKPQRNKKRSTKNNKKHFINKYNWEEIGFPSEKDDWKNLRKINEKLFSMFCILRSKKYILLMF